MISVAFWTEQVYLRWDVAQYLGRAAFKHYWERDPTPAEAARIDEALVPILKSLGDAGCTPTVANNIPTFEFSSPTGSMTTEDILLKRGMPLATPSWDSRKSLFKTTSLCP